MKIIQIAMLSALMAGLAACGSETPAPSARIAKVPPARTQAEQTPKKLDEPGQVPVITPSGARIRIAILLPLTGSERATGNALLRAATMALFDAYDPRLELMPFDTKADPADAAVAAAAARDAGAKFVIGPLLAENVAAAGEVLAPAHIPLIGFSNDSRVAAPGRYILGFMPESEVSRVVDYTINAGYHRYAALLPLGLYGDRVRATFGDVVADGHGQVTAMEVYPPDAAAVFEPVKRLANYDARKRALQQEIKYLRSLNDDVTDEIAENLEKNEILEPVPYDVVLVPEGGALLRTVAPLLPFYEIDPNKVKLIGTGLWNDPSVLNEPPLQGAWFAAPDPAAPNAFLARYRQQYQDDAPRIATLAYDAMGLVASLARDWTGDDKDDPFEAARLTDERGFVGLDGLFRFLPDGTNERRLAVLEINKGGFKVVDPAPSAFAAFGYLLRPSASREDN